MKNKRVDMSLGCRVSSMLHNPTFGIFKLGLSVALLLGLSVILTPTVNAADLDETLIYRLANAGFDRLGQKMCLDVINGGPHNNELDSRECANFTGQFWRFSGTMTELRHLPTYRMSTVFRGEDMCLTMDGTLVDHVLRMAPCSDSQRDNQIWIVTPAKDENGWEITPYLEEFSDKFKGFQLVVSAPFEGDGRPYVDAKTYMGKGYIWRISAVHEEYLILHSVTYNFDDFCDLSPITVSGMARKGIINPAIFGGQCVLRLTNGAPWPQAGGGFLSKPVPLSKNASFSTAFDFQITKPAGISDSDGQGGNGLVFVIQTKDNLLGREDGGIGYSGDKSVGVEFDTWNNGRSDGNNGNHIGIDLNGDVHSVARKNISIRMNNGAIWHAWVDYNGITKSMEVRLSQKSIRPAAATLSHKVDLPAVLGRSDAFVGFTSGSDAAGGIHDIRNWQFKNSFDPIVARE